MIRDLLFHQARGTLGEPGHFWARAESFEANLRQQLAEAGVGVQPSQHARFKRSDDEQCGSNRITSGWPTTRQGSGGEWNGDFATVSAIIASRRARS